MFKDEKSLFIVNCNLHTRRESNANMNIHYTGTRAVYTDKSDLITEFKNSVEDSTQLSDSCRIQEAGLTSPSALWNTACIRYSYTVISSSQLFTTGHSQWGK